MNNYKYLTVFFFVLVLFISYKVIFVNNDVYELGNEFDYLTIDRINLGMIDISVNEPHLLTVIYEASCEKSIINEIENINNRLDSLQNDYTVLYVGERDQYLKELGAKFVYYPVTLEKTKNVFGKVLEPRNPISFIFDENFVLNTRVVNVEKPFSEKLTDSYYSMVVEMIQ